MLMKQFIAISMDLSLRFYVDGIQLFHQKI